MARVKAESEEGKRQKSRAAALQALKLAQLAQGKKPEASPEAEAPPSSPQLRSAPPPAARKPQVLETDSEEDDEVLPRQGAALSRSSEPTTAKTAAVVNAQHAGKAEVPVTKRYRSLGTCLRRGGKGVDDLACGMAYRLCSAEQRRLQTV